MKYQFQPEALRAREPFSGDAYYEHMKTVARECLLWNMSLAEHDALTQVEYQAWVHAWNKLNEEKG